MSRISCKDLEDVLRDLEQLGRSLVDRYTEGHPIREPSELGVDRSARALNLIRCGAQARPPGTRPRGPGVQPAAAPQRRPAGFLAAVLGRMCPAAAATTLPALRRAKVRFEQNRDRSCPAR
jgi:hypothetical protein